MDIEHSDITHARRTGYPRGTSTEALPWFPNAKVDDNAFPYEPDEEKSNKTPHLAV